MNHEHNITQIGFSNRYITITTFNPITNLQDLISTPGSCVGQFTSGLTRVHINNCRELLLLLLMRPLEGRNSQPLTMRPHYPRSGRV